VLDAIAAYGMAAAQRLLNELQHHSDRVIDAFGIDASGRDRGSADTSQPDQPGVAEIA